MAKRHLKIRATLHERFAEKYIPEPNSGCWLWIGGSNELGYGVIGLGRREQGTAKAHRVSWILHRGPIPTGMAVCHKCDVPSCVNPDHLFLGSLSDNSRDCADKGRNVMPDNRGERAKWAKLTAGAVQDIRLRRMTGVAYAKLYGVSKSAIYQVWGGGNWTGV